MSTAQDTTLANAPRIHVGAMAAPQEGESAAAGRFISSWLADANSTNHNVIFKHGLGTIPTSLSVQFSVDQKTVQPVIWPWDQSSSGNPVSVWMDDTFITLSVFQGAPLHGWWNGSTGAWTVASTGFWRVIASA